MSTGTIIGEGDKYPMHSSAAFYSESNLSELLELMLPVTTAVAEALNISVINIDVYAALLVVRCMGTAFCSTVFLTVCRNPDCEINGLMLTQSG